MRDENIPLRKNAGRKIARRKNADEKIPDEKQCVVRVRIICNNNNESFWVFFVVNR